VSGKEEPGKVISMNVTHIFQVSNLWSANTFLGFEWKGQNLTRFAKI